MNTMVMSIPRGRAIRDHEGHRRQRRRHPPYLYSIEASSIGFLGGVAGVVLGWSVGRIINLGANVYIERQGGTPGNLFSLPWWLIGGAIGFSIAVSPMAGLYPASRAAKLDPIKALRHD